MSPRWNRIGLGLGVALAMSGAALAQQPDPHAGHTADQKSSQMAGGDQAFVQKAGMSGLKEVEAGRIALRVSTNDQVKAFAQHMVDDHSKANQELKAAASQEGLKVPAEMDAKHRADLDKLQGLKGDQFDAAFKAAMIKDHQEAVSLFEKEATSGKSALDQFAAKTLPNLKEHLKMAQDLPGGSGSAGSR